jgi:hypothetical protein
MGLVDRNGDLVINGQRIRNYNNLKEWKIRPKAKDGFLRWDKRTDFWYFDGDDGTQEELIIRNDYFGKEYGFEKIEEMQDAVRRKESEKRRGHHKCYVCNIQKPGAMYLLLENMGYIQGTCNCRP